MTVQLSEIANGAIYGTFYYAHGGSTSKSEKLNNLTYEEIDAILDECNKYHGDITFFKNVKTQITDEIVRRRKNKILYLKEKIHG